jgi:hypothetical protein
MQSGHKAAFIPLVSPRPVDLSIAIVGLTWGIQGNSSISSALTNRKDNSACRALGPLALLHKMLCS